MINGKDYYRCGRLREGGCDSGVSVRKTAIEDIAFAVIRERLFTTELAELFAAEFTRELRRLRERGDDEGARLRRRIAELDGEIANIVATFARGVVSDAVAALLADREAERTRLVERLARVASVATAEVLPHPVLMERYARRIETAHLALSDPEVREEVT